MVVREPHGWAVRLGPVMKTPFRLRASAIREAHCLCDALREHGEAAEVIVEDEDLVAALTVAASVEPSPIVGRSGRGD